MTIVRRAVAAALSLSMLSSCATLLYPERRGNHSGAIDVVPLVVDILLFIPGLIPGVIAIAVDFSTGAIYTGGGKRADRLDVGPEGEITVKRPALEQDTRVELRLVDRRRRVLSQGEATWVAGPADASDEAAVAVSIEEAVAASRSNAEQIPMFLEVVVDDRRTARYPLRVHREPLEGAGDPTPLPLPVLAQR